MDYFSDLFSLDFNAQCTWLPMNQFLFQFANIFLVLTYFIKPSDLHGLLKLRTALAMAGLCFGIWGGTIICSLDCMLWNIVFALGNVVHIVYLLMQTRHKQFTPEHEAVFLQVFAPLAVKRFEYARLAQAGELRCMTKGEFFATRNTFEPTSIAIVVSGSFGVFTSRDHMVGHIDAMEFVNSPEWLAANANHHNTTYMVSIKALEESWIIEWSKKELLEVLSRENVLNNVFDSLIGRDVCKKLFQVHTRLLTDRHNDICQAPALAYSRANLHETESLPCHVPVIRRMSLNDVTLDYVNNNWSRESNFLLSRETNI